MTIDFDGLRMVGRAVEEAPEHHVDMDVWTCGTSACAIGWFCRMNPGDALYLHPDTEIPSMSSLVHFDAVANRFGLTAQQAEDIFSTDSEWLISTHKPRFLARLAQFIADHEPKPSVEVKADAAFMRSLDVLERRNAEDAEGAGMVGEQWDGLA